MPFYSPWKFQVLTHRVKSRVNAQVLAQALWLDPHWFDFLQNLPGKTAYNIFTGIHEAFFLNKRYRGLSIIHNKRILIWSPFSQMCNCFQRCIFLFHSKYMCWASTNVLEALGQHTKTKFLPSGVHRQTRDSTEYSAQVLWEGMGQRCAWEQMSEMLLEGHANLAHHDYSKHSLLPSTCRDPKVHRFGESGGKSNAVYSNKKPYTISLMCLIIKYMKITTIVMLNYCFLDTKSLKGWCKSMRL